MTDDADWGSVGEPAAAATEAPPEAEVAVVLVVAADAVSRRFVEMALGRAGADFVVEGARDGAAALEILASRLVDLVITDSELPDMTGLDLARAMARGSRLAGVPVLFLSADQRAATRVIALRAGIEDFLVKPCDASELSARIEAAVGRRRRFGAALRNRSYTLAGDFTTIAFPDVVVLLEMGRRSGVLSISTTRAVGEVYFDAGRVVHAAFGNLGGAPAFYRMMAETTGQFEFTTVVIEDLTPTINTTVTALVMEGARLLDTERREAGRRPEVSVLEPPPRPPTGMHLPMPSAQPSATLAQQLQEEISDRYALGELLLLHEDELAEWTRVPQGRERVHALLIADLAGGVATLLSLASTPTERAVLAALSERPKILGLSYHLRFERVLDIVLLDIRRPAQFIKGLRRSPSCVIFAPPDGDYLGVGTRVRVDLENLLSHLQPWALVGVGNGALDGQMRSLAAVRRAGIAFRHYPGVAGDASLDARDLLSHVLRLWGSCGKAQSQGGTP